MRTFLRPSWIVDGTGRPPLAGHAVAIVDGLIDALLPRDSFQSVEGDRLVDLEGMTILPGLLNNHAHLVLPGNAVDNSPFLAVDTSSDGTLALRAAHNLGVALRSGVTTVRDCGGRGTVVLDARDAQAAGLFRGSRVLSCGWPLTITGGHLRSFGGEVDGVDAARRMVRKVVSLGADFVKVVAAGGGTPGSYPNRPSFCLDELKAIVEEAHNLGRAVSAHCMATASMVNAIEAGVDLMEHASFTGPDGQSHFDPELAELLAASAIPVTPTLQQYQDVPPALPLGPERDEWERRHEVRLAIMRRLRELGVQLLAGSDAGWRMTAFDTFWRELDELVACGMSPVAAVHAATGAVSRALGRDGLFGTVEAGRIADLLVVEGDIASDIRRLRQVRAVYQGGTLMYHWQQGE